MSRLRVLLADDHPIVRSGLRALIEAQSDMQVVGEAFEGETAARMAVELRPDVVVVDVSMPGVGGEAATARIRQDCSEVKVIALTAHEDRGYLKRLLAAGASGYLLKRGAADDLARAIRCVAAGGTFLDPAVAEQAAAELAAPRVGATAELSDREADVLRLVARGYLIKQIAAELGVEARTVETYKARAMEKLGLKTRVDVVRFAAEQGWLSTE